MGRIEPVSHKKDDLAALEAKRHIRSAPRRYGSLEVGGDHFERPDELARQSHW